MKYNVRYGIVALSLLAITSASAQKKKTAEPVKDNYPVNSATLNAFRFRNVGPALTSGRISDIAVNPTNSAEYYVAASAGGVWKTTNAGTTYNPVFDGQGSYSIGCVTIDPSNPNTVWVGTGENNNQRSVSYGDGIYKSEDGGKSWKNMGLTQSEHIGKIIVDPTDPNIVYVAAYGPLWSSGGDRGIYKTMDGGKTWRKILEVSVNTGFSEIHMDPRNDKTLYASAHQRQRSVFTYIGGGPETAVYKSTDSGHTWNKIMSGLPSGDIGRIALAVSPVNPDILYAMVEAREGGGTFISKDRGQSWQKRGSYSTSGNYYQRLFCDPKDADKLYAIDTYFGVSTDAGKTFTILGEKNKHIDNHVIWIDPKNTDHLLVGCDGGLYESYDAAENWEYKPNLPVTQFYKVATDNAFPFYHIHGGTQDNFSLGGPSRTTSSNGIMNSDWYFTSLGDGFESQVDQTDPNIIYAQAQYGSLVRYDRKTGEKLNIQPQEKEGEQAYRWNWDAPLVISRFDNKRLYFASNKVFRTDDRGNTWKVISPDLSRQIDRNKLTVMGKVWSVDAVAKNQSTDIYGNITTLAESSKDENLLYAGTDDGAIHVTSNGGESWTKLNLPQGVPENTYVNQLLASQHDKSTVYAVFNHHRYGDFKPYIYRSRDAGKTWTALQNNLPVRGTVYSVAEDHVNPDLLFAGTEFGVFVTIDGGSHWAQLKGGMPTIAIRDLEIQRRENDLVLASFGRGFFVLDDYSPLRQMKPADLEKEAIIYPVKDALMFMPDTRLGVRGKGFLGESLYTAPNPPIGATFTYYLKDDIKTIKEKRKEREQELIKKGQPPYYPTIDSLRLEDEQPEPHLLFTITDESGNVVRRLKAPAKKGLQRMVWDFRYSPTTPIDFTPFDESFAFSNPAMGQMALPGTYKVSMSKFEDGKYSQLTEPVSFKTVALNAATLPAEDQKAVAAFTSKLAGFVRVVNGTDQYRRELVNRVRYLKAAVLQTPNAPLDIATQLAALDKRLNAVNVPLNGDATKARREFETSPSVNGRLGSIMFQLWNSTSGIPGDYTTSYNIAEKQFSPIYAEIKSIGEEVKKIEATMEKSGAPYTPGRLPEWNAGMR
jgi:photosystem II stability/assembly factor-like uncharacterized protein